MRRLHISIEIDGKEYNVGTITGNSSQDACFCYDRDYVRQVQKPISISLPLQSEPFSERQTCNFFEGLLPEGFSRRAVADWIHAQEDDYLSILSGLGQECIGALRVIEEEKSRVKPAYVKLSLPQVKALAAEGASKSTKLLVESHLSLAGASGKTGLYYDSAEKQWYQPKGDAPSTHIVKQSHVRFQNIIENELLCLKTAEFMGIKTAESFLVNTGEGKEEDILFATMRYDRVEDSERIINHLKAPKRLHQEDFAQALGIAAKDKYEKRQQGYLQKMFALLRKYSSNPIEDQTMLWKRIIFDILIGNTDGHLKNFSLLYHSSLGGLRLAPAYDIISSEIYGFNKEMSLFIGGTNQPESITTENIQIAAKEAGLGQKMAMEIWKTMEDSFLDSLERAALQLQNNGLKNVTKIKQQMIEINREKRKKQ